MDPVSLQTLYLNTSSNKCSYFKIKYNKYSWINFPYLSFCAYAFSTVKENKKYIQKWSYTKMICWPSKKLYAAHRVYCNFFCTLSRTVSMFSVDRSFAFQWHTYVDWVFTKKVVLSLVTKRLTLKDRQIGTTHPRFHSTVLLC